MSRHGPPKEYTIAQRKRRDRKARSERLRNLADKIDMLRALMSMRDKSSAPEDIAETRRLRAKIRVCEQQARYIGEEFDP